MATLPYYSGAAAEKVPLQALGQEGIHVSWGSTSAVPKVWTVASTMHSGEQVLYAVQWRGELRELRVRGRLAGFC